MDATPQSVEKIWHEVLNGEISTILILIEYRNAVLSRGMLITCWYVSQELLAESKPSQSDSLNIPNFQIRAPPPENPVSNRSVRFATKNSQNQRTPTGASGIQPESPVEPKLQPAQFFQVPTGVSGYVPESPVEPKTAA